MARPNEEVEALLQEYADLVDIIGKDSFRARSYEKAARSIGGYHADVSGMSVGELRKIPNVGASIAEKVVEYFETGSVRAIEDARAKIPAGVRQLTAIPTLGPKKAMQLYEQLHVSSIDELLEAIGSEKLRGIKGFGPKTEQNILHGIELMQQAGDRVHINVAMELAERVLAELSEVDGCERCCYAGSLRRMRDSIGDIDILAAAADSGPLMAAFSRAGFVREVIGSGTTKTSVRTTTGLQVDLRVVPPDAWGAALQYFTGSKEHNVRTREIAVGKGLKLSEYGLFDVDSGKKIVSETEEEVYAQLGLPWIPPVLREDRGEIKAARRGELPVLVSQQDIRGDLHTHTTLTDGLSSLEEMVETAATRGYAYYAITDHAPNLSMQRMTDEKMLAQREAVRALDARQPVMRLLHGTELNIDPDGEVDWPPEFLAGFDICVASVHSHFTQSREEMTRRFVRACENPYVNIIGHPTTRLIGRRPGVDVDLDAVLAAAARTGTALEINAYPDRLDLRDDDVFRARQHGVKFAVNTDSHATVHLDYLRYGIGMAQRGWLTKDDVINAWPLDRLRKFLRKGR